MLLKKLKEAAELEAQRAAEKARLIAIKEEELRPKIEIMLSEFNGDKIRAQNFVVIRGIVCEQLCVEETEVGLHTCFRYSLYADSLDQAELLMALEEVFEIEVKDEVVETCHSIADILCLFEQNDIPCLVERICSLNETVSIG